MTKIGVAVVGCGAMAQGTHLPNIVRNPELELRWCCDVNAETLGKVRDRFHPRQVTASADEVARDKACEVVLISTTHKVRFSLIKLFSEAGKSIYVEKPLADRFDEMRAIAAQIKRTGVPFCVGHNRRMSPAVREAVRIYRKHRANPVSPSWRWDREGARKPPFPEAEQTMVLIRVNDDFWSWKAWSFEDGALINELTHFVDLAGCFIEAPPVRVMTQGGRRANCVLTVEYADGSLATIFAAANGTFDYPKELVEIYHNGAGIIVDHMVEVRAAGVVGEPFRTVFPLGDGTVLPGGIREYHDLTLARRAASTKHLETVHSLGPDKGHYSLLDALAHEGRGGPPTPCGLAESLKSTAVILRALESHAAARPVAIAPADYAAE